MFTLNSFRHLILVHCDQHWNVVRAVCYHRHVPSPRFSAIELDNVQADAYRDRHACGKLWPVFYGFLVIYKVHSIHSHQRSKSRTEVWASQDHRRIMTGAGAQRFGPEGRSQCARKCS